MPMTATERAIRDREKRTRAARVRQTKAEEAPKAEETPKAKKS